MRIGFFVLLLSLGLNSCAAAHFSGIEFYEGLKKRGEAQAEALVCFEKALNADNPHIAAAAAAELMTLHSAGTELSPALMAAINQKVNVLDVRSSWADALKALEPPHTPEKLLTLLMTGDSRSLGASSIDSEAARYALQQWRDSTDSQCSLSEAENAAIDGRIAASRSRYNEALVLFRITLNELPELFFKYPDLLSDLGRTFQYTATGREGMDLFLEWEKIFSDKGSIDSRKSLLEAIPAGSENSVRYRLLFFAARIARQGAASKEGAQASIELFERALPFAREVSPEQSDACIWYILDTSLSGAADKTVQYLETYIPQWHDDSYFFDIVDKLSREFILKKQWVNIESVYKLLRAHSGAATAKYAWIMGRLSEEGLFSSEEAPSAYMRIAYNASGSGAAFGNIGYYRSFSAAALNEPFLAPAEAPQTEASKPVPVKGKAAKNGESDALQFLLGFFEHNAAQFAPRYIRTMEQDLSAEELYRIAKALGAVGQYQESIRLVSLYARRGSYQLTKQDLELLYPCPYKKQVDRYAGETGLDPALLYGLIRTESAFDSNAVSRAGAIGLTQLMPATAEETAARIRRQGGPNYIQTSVDEAIPIILDLRDPAVNIHIGAAYLAYLDGRMEDILLALLAYNGGMSRVRRWRASVNRSVGALAPDLFLETVEYAETRNYGRNVMGAAAMYQELYYQSRE